MIEGIAPLYRLKEQPRQGWRLRGVADPESVADHSWGTALLCTVFAEQAGVDRGRAVEIALVHDLAEAITGDVPTRVATMNDDRVIADKRASERAAMETLTRTLDPATRLRVTALWREYEERASAEALFVRDMNLIDMLLQAYVYEADRRYDEDCTTHFDDYAGMDEFFATSVARIATPIGGTLYDEVARAYASLPAVVGRGGFRV